MTSLLRVAASAPHTASPRDDRSPVLRVSVPRRSRASDHEACTSGPTCSPEAADSRSTLSRRTPPARSPIRTCSSPERSASARARPRRCSSTGRSACSAAGLRSPIPKGEYLPLAEALGLDVIKLHPGGTARINPLDPGPAGLDDGPDELARRQATMVGALLGSVLHRDLTPVEDAVLGWAVRHLARTARTDVTLADVATVMASPTEEMAHLARTDAIDLARSVEAAIYGLGKLLDRSLRGMFDGPTTVHLDWNGPGIVLDLSAVHNEPEALTLVMIATTAWLQAVLARPDGPPRLQVLDEAWSLLGSERTTRYLQACWKLSRAYGVANLAIVHRLSDLRAQADDGTATSKLSMGLLADTQTRVSVPSVERPSTRRNRTARTHRTRSPAPPPAHEGTGALEGG